MRSVAGMAPREGAQVVLVLLAHRLLRIDLRVPRARTILLHLLPYFVAEACPQAMFQVFELCRHLLHHNRRQLLLSTGTDAALCLVWIVRRSLVLPSFAFSPPTYYIVLRLNRSSCLFQKRQRPLLLTDCAGQHGLPL